MTCDVFEAKQIKCEVVINDGCCNYDIYLENVYTCAEVPMHNMHNIRFM